VNDPMSLTEAARTALRCLDLTSLGDHDSTGDIERLCERAIGRQGPVAAVCVWPRFAALARRRLPASIAVAAVANFPAGGIDAEAALADVHPTVAAGAQELDVVLPWRALRDGDDAAAARLLDAVRRASAGLTLKVILESGELGDAALILRAARLALAHGADFLKTSTGKTPRGATPQAWRGMLQAIADDPHARHRAGVKASGGMRSVAGTLPYIELCRDVLGPASLTPQRFRIGASSLLDDIEAVLGGTVAARARDDH
jgi:deoxyribose-phosphate aldolase